MTLSRREFLVHAGATAAAAAGAGLLSQSPVAGSVLPSAARLRDPSLAPATVTMWTNHPEWVNQVNTLVKMFEKQNPSVKIAVTAKTSETYPALITSAIAAGSAPDIFGFLEGLQYADIANAGHLLDLTGKIDVGRLLPAAASVIYVGKKIYAMPLFGDFTTGMFYWKPVFDKFNITIPSTWSQFTNLCKTLQSKSGIPALGMPSQDGIIPTFVWTGFMSTVRGPAGVSAIIDGKAKLTDPDFLAATTYLQSLTPYFAPGYAATAYTNGKADFAEMKSVMFEGGSSDYAGFLDINPHLDLGFFAFPHPDNMGVSAVNTGIDYLYGINSSTTNPAKVAAALAFFNFLLTPQAGAVIAATLELPETKGVAITSPIQKEVIKQSTYAAPEWFQIDQLSGMWNYALENISDMLVGSVTPKHFAAACQALIK